MPSPPRRRSASRWTPNVRCFARRNRSNGVRTSSAKKRIISFVSQRVVSFRNGHYYTSTLLLLLLLVLLLLLLLVLLLLLLSCDVFSSTSSPFSNLVLLLLLLLLLCSNNDDDDDDDVRRDVQNTVAFVVVVDALRRTGVPRPTTPKQRRRLFNALLCGEDDDHRMREKEE